MTTQTKHTSLPWVFSYGSIYQNLSGVLGPRIALMDRATDSTMPTERDENARLIVKAVNSHYALVEACQAACEAASNCLPPSGKGELDAGYYKAKLLAIDKAAAKCSQALALAEKGQP